MAWQILPGLFELGNGRTRVAEADQRHTENEPGLGVIGHQVDGLLGGLGRGLEASGSQQTVTAKHQVVGQEESGGCIFGVLLGDQPEAIFGIGYMNPTEVGVLCMGLLLVLRRMMARLFLAALLMTFLVATQQVQKSLAQLSVLFGSAVKAAAVCGSGSACS